MAPRGNPILGISRFRENSTHLPYTTLTYGNGPGGQLPRNNPSLNNATASPNYVQYAAINQEEAFHDGGDVAVYASGPFAHLFQGSQEQSYIAHVLSYAMCLGRYSDQPHCDSAATSSNQIPKISLGDAGSTMGRTCKGNSAPNSFMPSLSLNIILILCTSSALSLYLKRLTTMHL